MDKDGVFKKRAPILDNIGITGYKADWVSEYMNNISDDNELGLTSSNESFPSILPIAIRVASQTIGQNLVSVQPVCISTDELERISKEVLSENRDRKIDAIVEGEEYKEMKVEEHPDYKSGRPSGKLFYMDFKYDNSTNKKKAKKLKPLW